MIQVKVVEKDPALPHQIVILASKNAGCADVSCNCLRLTSRGGHKVMGTAPYNDLDMLWSIYKNRENHNNHRVPEFDPDQSQDKTTVYVW